MTLPPSPRARTTRRPACLLILRSAAFAMPSMTLSHADGGFCEGVIVLSVPKLAVAVCRAASSKVYWCNGSRADGTLVRH